LITDYAERLSIRYGAIGQIVEACYTHYADDGNVHSQELITQNKRKRVLELINQKDVGE
jgi:hypothetical protein